MSVDGRDLGAPLLGLREKITLLCGELGGIGFLRRRVSRERIVWRGKLGLEARHIELDRKQIALEMVLFGGVDGGIEVDESVAGADFLSVADIDGADDARLEGLDGLGASGWNDLAGGRGDNIDLAETGPENGGAERRDHRPDDGAANGRGRRVDDFKRGRQKGQFIPCPTDLRQGDGVIRRLFHRCLPGCDAAWRIGPWS